MFGELGKNPSSRWDLIFSEFSKHLIYHVFVVSSLKTLNRNLVGSDRQMQRLEETELRKADRTVGVTDIYFPIFRQARPGFFSEWAKIASLAALSPTAAQIITLLPLGK